MIILHFWKKERKRKGNSFDHLRFFFFLFFLFVSRRQSFGNHFSGGNAIFLTGCCVGKTSSDPIGGERLANRGPHTNRREGRPWPVERRDALRLFGMLEDARGCSSAGVKNRRTNGRTRRKVWWKRGHEGAQWHWSRGNPHPLAPPPLLVTPIYFLFSGPKKELK